MTTRQQQIQDIQRYCNRKGGKLIVDGKLGPITIGTLHRVLGLGAWQTTKHRIQPLAITEDERSAKNIATLVPELQPKFTAWLRRLKVYARTLGVDVKIICGLRTHETQNALYAKGRTKPGPKVTWVRGGYSMHQYGLAVDIGIFRGNDYLDDNRSKNDRAICTLIQREGGKLAKDYGIDWGGNWKRTKDYPHFQYNVGFNMTEIRRRHKLGKPLV